MSNRIEDFYVESDGDDWTPALERAMANWRSATDPRGFTVYFGPRTYNFQSTIHLLRGMRLVGEGGARGEFGTIFQFPPDTTGMVVHHVSDFAPTQGRADMSVVDNICFRSSGSSMIAHGIDINAARVSISNCLFTGFANGINIVAADQATSNADVGMFLGVRCIGNRRDGIYLRGEVANQSTFVACDLISNARWGLNDESFLGNQYFGLHASNNGSGGGLSAGGVGGPFRCVGNSARSGFYQCYAEGGYGASYVDAPSIVVGGFVQVAGSAIWLDDRNFIATYPNGVAGLKESRQEVEVALSLVANATTYSYQCNGQTVSVLSPASGASLVGVLRQLQTAHASIVALEGVVDCDELSGPMVRIVVGSDAQSLSVSESDTKLSIAFQDQLTAYIQIDTVQNSAVYSVVIQGIAVSHTSSGAATAASIRDGLLSSIGSMVPQHLATASRGGQLRVRAHSAGTAFTLTAVSNVTPATVRANLVQAIGMLGTDTGIRQVAASLSENRDNPSLRYTLGYGGTVNEATGAEFLPRWWTWYWGNTNAYPFAMSVGGNSTVAPEGGTLPAGEGWCRQGLLVGNEGFIGRVNASRRGSGGAGTAYGFTFGQNQAGTSRSWFIGFRTSPPTLGTYAVGDLIINGGASSAQGLGWICIAAGTPGSWLSLGAGGGIVEVSATTYTVGRDDEVLLLTAAGARTVTLPSGSPLVANGHRVGRLTIKDKANTAGAAPIVINAAGGETIDGAASLTIAVNRGAVRLAFSGTQWSVV